MAQNQSFPNLSKLLGNLRSGLRQFGLFEIEDLFRGRNDRDFRKKASQKLQLLQDAVEEIQKKCFRLKNSPDPNQIKYLLWKKISKQNWDADKVGGYIIAQLHASAHEGLICLPLYGSVAPWRKEPIPLRLSPGVWVLETPHSIDRLIIQLEYLIGALPKELEAELRKIDDPSSSEFSALLSEPLLAIRTTGGSVFSQRDHALFRFGMPLLALRNIVDVNKLDTSDDLALVYYMMKLAPPAWPEKLRREWECAHDDPIALENGITEPHHIVSITDSSRKIWSYDFDLKDGTISPSRWSSVPLRNRPPLLMLRSVLKESNTKKLIDYGLQLSQTQLTDWDRKIAHAILMWTKASAFMQGWDWEGGFNEADWAPVLVDPDSLILYSTIVLESLFSSEGETQEVTSRIADFSAALLGRSGDDRYELAKTIKRLYGLRSKFVHGSVDRPDSYSEESARLFKMATLALWEVVQLRTASHPPFSKREDFEKYVQRRKFGAEVGNRNWKHGNRVERKRKH